MAQTYYSGVTVVFHCVLTVVLALGPHTQTESSKVVSEAEAASHLTQRIEPKIPPIAFLTKVGGVVKLHVVIAASGDVASADFVSGPPLLVDAAIEAVKQWKYAPFLSGETPIKVSADVEIVFPGAPSTQEQAINRKYFDALNECEDLLKNSAYADAEPKCRVALNTSDLLPKTAVLERIHALAMLANAIFYQRRFSEALPLYKQSLAMAKSYDEPDDADLAGAHANLARAYAVTGDLSQADAEYAVAVSTFKAAIKRLPSMHENYSRRLLRTLKEFSQVKEAEGQTDAAADLRKQAAEIKP